jgi:hypothetical protein
VSRLAGNSVKARLTQSTDSDLTPACVTVAPRQSGQCTAYAYWANSCRSWSWSCAILYWTGCSRRDDRLVLSIEALSAIDKGSEFLAILAVIEHLVEGIDLDSDAGHSLASLPWCGRALEERSVLFLEGH